LREVKEKELLGYSYDGVGASFELMALEQLDRLPVFFTVQGYTVNITNDGNAKTVSEASVSLVIDGETVTGKGTGNGPVNALDTALRADLKRYASTITGMRLVDFKVRILDTGTEAVTRVTIEVVDEAGDSWRTIGVNANIVVASFEALKDALVYKLFKDGVSAVPDAGVA
jgi:2-isopropylmalate synthase